MARVLGEAGGAVRGGGTATSSHLKFLPQPISVIFHHRIIQSQLKLH